MSNALMALIAQRKAATSRQNTLKPPAGRSRYKILPGWRKDDSKGPREQFYQDFGQHFLKNAAGEIKSVYVCVDKTYGRPCPICDMVAQGITNSVDDAEKKRMEDARASGRVLLNVLHLDGQQPNTVQVLEVPPSVFNGKKGVGGIINLFTDWPNLLNVDGDGLCDIVIEKSGTGMNTEYAVSAVPGKPVNPAVLNQLHDLDAFVAQESGEGQQRALAAVSALTGLLPAPSRPSLSEAAASAFSQKPVAAQTFDDVPDFMTPAQQAQEAAVQTATMQPPPASTAAAPAQPAPVVTPAPVQAATVAPAGGEQDLMKLLEGL
jgi:gp32 DNA binding protein like